MSTRPPPSGGKKPAAPPTRTRRISTVAQARPARRGGRDLFGLYFVLGAAVFILLFGATVWGLRGLASRSAVALVATPSATAETVAALPTAPLPDTPLAGFTPPPIPSLAAPDAINSGAFAPAASLTSTFADLTNLQQPPKLPAQIPQPHLDLSPTTIDLGDVTAQTTMTREITLANSGVHDLIVRALAVDCRCMQAQADAQRLPSGTRTRVVLSYDGSTDDSGSGPAAHKLAIVSNDGQSPVTLITINLVLP